jgi:hypothetical protein
MAEEFLEAQIRRIREMSEQFSRVRPLYEIRDWTSSSEEKIEAHDEPVRAPKPSARHSSRRRGR